jgi:hypothetical protein
MTSAGHAICKATIGILGGFCTPRLSLPVLLYGF